MSAFGYVFKWALFSFVLLLLAIVGMYDMNYALIWRLLFAVWPVALAISLLYQRRTRPVGGAVTQGASTCWGRHAHGLPTAIGRSI